MKSKPRVSTFAVVASVVLLSAAGSALAQSSAGERNFTYLGRNTTSVIMITGAPAFPPTGQATVWLWNFFGPGHERSSPTGSFGRAIRMTVDCSNRSSISRSAEMYNGVGFSHLVELTGQTWSAPAPDTLGSLPISGVCDPAPPTPQTIYSDLAAARAFADEQLRPAATASR